MRIRQTRCTHLRDGLHLIVITALNLNVLGTATATATAVACDLSLSSNFLKATSHPCRTLGLNTCRTLLLILKSCCR